MSHAVRSRRSVAARMRATPASFFGKLTHNPVTARFGVRFPSPPWSIQHFMVSSGAASCEPKLLQITRFNVHLPGQYLFLSYLLFRLRGAIFDHGFKLTRFMHSKGSRRDLGQRFPVPFIGIQRRRTVRACLTPCSPNMMYCPVRLSTPTNCPMCQR